MERSDHIDRLIQLNIVKFLRELADKLENNDLGEDAKKHITEFFMRFNFVSKLFEKIDPDNPSEDEVLKFLSLGWYVYTQLIEKD